MSQYYHYPVSGDGGGVPTYPTFASLPASPPDGTLGITLDTHILWMYDAGTADWIVTGGYSAGDMLTLTGEVFSVDLAAVSGLESTNPGNAGGQLRINLESSNPSLQINGSNELGAKLDPAGAIISGASGLAVSAGVGIDLSGNDVNQLAAYVASGASPSASSGIRGVDSGSNDLFVIGYADTTDLYDVGSVDSLAIINQVLGEITYVSTKSNAAADAANTGDFNAFTGAQDDVGSSGSSGVMYLSSGSVLGSGSSGAANLRTGETASGNSGNIQIRSGDVIGGSGNSGNVTLRTGTSDGGSRGTIFLNADHVELNNIQIKVLADPTDAQDAVNKQYVDATVPLTTKGDLLGFSTIPARVPVGSNNQVLMADSAQTLGVKYDSVGNASLAVMADNTVKANKSGGAAAPSDLALSDVVETGSAILTITNGANSVVSASDLSIEVQQAGAANDGYLSSADWNTFNNKQAAGSYITALTGDVTASGPGSAAATIANNVVSNAKLAQMPAHTFKGNNTGSTANADDLTSAELTAELDEFTDLLQGVVPASGGGTTNFLRADGTWAPASGSIADWTFNDQTGTTYTFALGDAISDGVIVTFDNAATQMITIPDNGTVAFPIGTQINCVQLGTGQPIIEGDVGVTLNALNNWNSFEGQYAQISLLKTDTDTWEMFGNVGPSYIVATGGTITTDGDYKIHTFNTSANFVITAGAGEVDSLLIGGGGGGAGNVGGGGGAGGFIYNSPGNSYSVGTYPIVVGAGGGGSTGAVSGTDGDDSTFDSYTAIGGGGGSARTGGANTTPGNGGSGGGGGGGDTGSLAGGSGTVGQGNDGGAGDNTAAAYAGGGGGGASAVGADAAAGATAGAGGAGSANSITGGSVTYAGGGGGGAQVGGGSTAGAGGAGGGGAGRNTAGGAATNGTANLGGGGGGGTDGGGSSIGGNGGAGVVILRYRFQ